VINDYGNLAEERMTNYIVVTPVFNEEKKIGITIESMIAQIVRPQLWIIVDDGSSDKTFEVISSAAEPHSWIKVHRRSKEQNRTKDGLLVASEAKAFLEGLDLALNTFENPEFIVKLDADLEFPSDYFAGLFREFSVEPRLGLAGGVIYEYKGSGLVRERVNSTHVRGATKVYRYACYKDIGGIRPMFGWDVIDEILACAHGWEVKSFDHLHLTHLRRTASRGGRFAGWARNGYMAYYIGMSPFRILLRVCFRLISTGDIVQASGLAAGYFGSFFKGTQRLPDPEIRKLVRQYQWATVLTSSSKQTHEA
jgi:glycosyltransferase involved in cell wall biosynthesis